MSKTSEQWALQVTWDEGVNLPSLIGPFGNESEAVEWAGLNVPNGEAKVVELAHPYLRARIHA